MGNCTCTELRKDIPSANEHLTTVGVVRTVGVGISIGTEAVKLVGLLVALLVGLLVKGLLRNRKGCRFGTADGTAFLGAILVHPGGVSATFTSSAPSDTAGIAAVVIVTLIPGRGAALGTHGTAGRITVLVHPFGLGIHLVECAEIFIFVGPVLITLSFVGPLSAEGMLVLHALILVGGRFFLVLLGIILLANLRTNIGNVWPYLSGNSSLVNSI